jgi:hypothetical protein
MDAITIAIEMLFFLISSHSSTFLVEKSNILRIKTKVFT